MESICHAFSVSHQNPGIHWRHQIFPSCPCFEVSIIPDIAVLYRVNDAVLCPRCCSHLRTLKKLFLWNVAHSISTQAFIDVTLELLSTVIERIPRAPHSWLERTLAQTLQHGKAYCMRRHRHRAFFHRGSTSALRTQDFDNTVYGPLFRHSW